MFLDRLIAVAVEKNVVVLRREKLRPELSSYFIADMFAGKIALLR